MVVTKDEIDVLLAKLTRYMDGGDYEGGYMMHDRPDGLYVEFDDVRELIQTIRAAAIEECALAAWRRGVDGAKPGETINRRVITGLIVNDIRAMARRDGE